MLRGLSAKDIPRLKKKLSQKGLVLRNQTDLPVSVASAVVAVTTENAGIPYKTTANTPDDYIRQSEKACIKSPLSKFPNVKVIEISEEKYSFTPDQFKADTRNQRKKSSESSIHHLKMSS